MFVEKIRNLLFVISLSVILITDEPDFWLLP
jgi:hypothetical protein